MQECTDRFLVDFGCLAWNTLPRRLDLPELVFMEFTDSDRSI
ncbi:unnamed protein product [Haemonchus placei]|uniref:Protein kinase domain-containing protein n=1 Tax=Haemonchus placei TaxID=6290 RepID=A0A0N4VYW2_HAEPC|nr:unnamed protein product [Haemonchus placei]